MSEEIYVNIGTSFQQPYQGQGLAQGRTPVIAQYIARKPANAQTPFTYQSRQPANARQPASAQTPYIASRQNPSIVQANANYPYNASAQQAYPYIASAQTSTDNTGRLPLIYSNQGRTPFTYARQGQTPYSATGRLPSTYATQGQTPYSFQQSYQQTYTRQGQQPYTFNDTGQQPSTYARQGREPYSFQQTYQVPTIYTAQVSTNSQATYQHPTTYQHQAQITYRHPTNSQSTFQTPVIAQRSYQHPYTATTPASAVGRQPTTYTYPDPAIWGPYPVTGGQISSYNYLYHGFRSSNPVAPTQFGAAFGSSPWPALPSIYTQKSWWVNKTYPTATTGVLNVGNFGDPSSPNGYGVYYGSNFSYIAFTTPSGTTNVPYATFTPIIPSGAAQPNYAWGGTLSLSTAQLSTHVLANGGTGSIAVF